MVNLITNNLDINTHELFELTRAFYPNLDVVIDSTTTKAEILILISFEDNKYDLSLLKDGQEVDLESIKVDSVNIFKDIKSTRKTALKKALFFLLKRDTSKDLPWGILTGIRPVKIVEDLFSKGINESSTLRVLMEEYLLSDEKAKLIIDVSKRQKMVIDKLKKNNYSLYVNIPFCPSKCVYCSFPTLTIKKYGNLMENYLKVLKKEILATKDIMKNWELSTIYIGGGTPTTLTIEQMEYLIILLKESFIGFREFTIEAGRPDTINEEYLKLFKKYNIDRISINPQTMNDKTLKTIGRQHNSKDILETYSVAKRIGIPVVNMDLIIGLPGEGIEELKYTLDLIKELDPENLTVHTLSIKKGSKFKEEKDNYNINDSIVIQKMINETVRFAKEMDLYPYYLYRQKQILGNFENVGYAKTNKLCLYNISIMEEKETIIALGMGGVSKFYNKELKTIERLSNFRNIEEYLNRVDELIQSKKENIYKIEKYW